MSLSRILIKYLLHNNRIHGEVSERLKEHDWKSCVRLSRTQGSNPCLSAIARGCNRMRFYRILVAVPFKYRKYQDSYRLVWAYRTKLVGFYADEVRKYLTSSAFYLFLNTLKGGQN